MTDNPNTVIQKLSGYVESGAHDRDSISITTVEVKSLITYAQQVEEENEINRTKLAIAYGVIEANKIERDTLREKLASAKHAADVIEIDAPESDEYCKGFEDCRQLLVNELEDWPEQAIQEIDNG